jgi:DNA-binding CsgD family transcriptional regulator
VKDQRRLATQARQLKKQGKTFREIAKELGISHMTAYNLAKRSS